MVVHKIKYGGVTYIGQRNKDGVLEFTPPLPPEYEERCSSNISSAIESRQFPGLNTDTTFLANRGMLDSQFDDKEALKNVVEGAQKQGYNPKPTDVYLSSLARFPGDKQAFVNGGDAKGHIRKICEERGVGCSGSVNIPQPDSRVDPVEARKKARERAIAKKARQEAIARALAEKIKKAQS